MLQLIKTLLKPNFVGHFPSYTIKWESTKKIGTTDLTYICSLLLYYCLNEETNPRFTKRLCKELSAESRKAVKVFLDMLPPRESITKDVLKETINLTGNK